ncbi:MAG: hypothetical protein MJ016_02565 [Victivallaceae bacterium]|nr:hypothetical protein [Victivallaceae bacterium]
MKKMKWLSALLCMAGIVFLAGCGGNRSPEATFKAMQKAAEKQDSKAFAACFLPDDKDRDMAAMFVCGDKKMSEMFCKLEIGKVTHPTADTAVISFKDPAPEKNNGHVVVKPNPITFRQRGGIWYATNE